jgi:hypothetical protein
VTGEKKIWEGEDISPLCVKVPEKWRNKNIILDEVIFIFV